MKTFKLTENDEEDQAVLDLVRVIRLCRPNRAGDACLLFDPKVDALDQFESWMPITARIDKMRQHHSEAWWAWVGTDCAKTWRRHFLRVHELASALRMREVEVAGRTEAVDFGSLDSPETSTALVVRLAEKMKSTPHPRPIIRFVECVLESPRSYSHVTLLAVFYAAFHYRTDIALGAWHFAEWKAGMRPFFEQLRKEGADFPEGVTPDDVDHFLNDNPGGFLHHVRAWTAGGEIAGMAISAAMERDV